MTWYNGHSFQLADYVPQEIIQQVTLFFFSFFSFFFPTKWQSNSKVGYFMEFYKQLNSPLKRCSYTDAVLWKGT